MKPRLLVAALSAVAAVAFTAGCGSESSAPPVVPAPGADPGQGETTTQAPPADLNDPVIAWAEKVCGAVESSAAPLSKLPALDPADPAKSKQGLIAYLESLSDALGAVGDGITAAGEPPVSDGAAAVDAAMTRIEALQASLGKAKDRLAKVETTDPVAFQSALAEIGPELESLNTTEGPTTDLKANPELKDAFAQAPTCRRVDGA